MCESVAAEETVPGVQKQGRYSAESRQALASPSTRGCLCHPAGCPEVPPSSAPEESGAGARQSSGAEIIQMMSENGIFNLIVCNYTTFFFFEVMTFYGMAAVF